MCAGHPEFDVVYAGGESSSGQRLGERFPGIGKLGDLVIEKWDPAALPKLDVLFASLPTGQSAAPLARVPASTRIVDIGGDHRYVDGWTYGLADVWPEEIKGKTRIANPGCFPAATLAALAPLLAERLIEPHGIIIDAKTGVSGAGRGGGEATMGYGEVNEDLAPYGLLKHVHMPEIAKTIDRLSGVKSEGLVFTPHLVPMTRGILATIYARGNVTTEKCIAAARSFYARSAVRARHRQAAAHQVGHGIEPRLRFVRVRSGAPPRDGDGCLRQSRQGRRGAGGAERQHHHRAARDGWAFDAAPLWP